MVRVNPAGFEPRYAASSDGDPWAFASSPYEQGRYATTITCLGRARYRRAFEPGCAVGELTARLATRCDEVVAIEPSATALELARRRTAGLPGVRLGLGAVPECWPSGTFDLVVFSELGYYFDRDELSRLVTRGLRLLEPGGSLLAVHWRGVSEDHLLHGDVVHAVLEATLGAPPGAHVVHPGFLCSRWDLP